MIKNFSLTIEKRSYWQIFDKFFQRHFIYFSFVTSEKLYLIKNVFLWSKQKGQKERINNSTKDGNSSIVRQQLR